MVNHDASEDGGADRGQALTIEAVASGILLLVAVGFALQMTAVTPLSASTSSQHLENQLESSAEGVLAATAESGALRDAVLYWNESEEKFHNATGDDYYRSGPPDTEFGDALNRAFGDRNIAYNVIVHYQLDGERFTQRMIYQGRPSDHAISASHTVALMDTYNLTEPDGAPELQRSSSYFIEDDAPDDPLFNVVRVEVIAWRI